MSTTTITLPFTERPSLTLDERNLGEVIRPASVTPVADGNVAIARALDAPLESLPIEDRVLTHGGETIPDVV
jgi:hypothetical protein